MVQMRPAFEPAWLAARRPFDEAALDRGAVLTIRRWADGRHSADPVRVVDLGSGIGAGLQRALRWLGDRASLAFTVDSDRVLLAAAQAAWRDDSWTVHPTDESRDQGCAPYTVFRNGQRTIITPLVADALAPLDVAGGPSDASIDLVLAHAFADLVPLDRLATRIHALLRPGGLAHLALTYDGETAFEPTDDARLEARVIAAYHRHMDRPRAEFECYGGSTAGRRLGSALEAAGLRIVRAAPSIWRVHAGRGDTAAAREVLARMIRFVADSVIDLDGSWATQIGRWESSRWKALGTGELSLRVRHVDVLATRAQFTWPKGFRP
jgi:SAM-dependent methyltransferase